MKFINPGKIEKKKRTTYDPMPNVIGGVTEKW